MIARWYAIFDLLLRPKWRCRMEGGGEATASGRDDMVL